MRQQYVETADVFRGAVLMCFGAKLETVRKDNIRKVSFIFYGKDLQDLDMKYHLGKTKVNPLHLKEFLRQLRGRIQQTLKIQNPENPNGYKNNDFRETTQGT